MSTFGPFHSLTEADQQALVDLLADGGISVRAAAAHLGLNYTHALNYAHTRSLVRRVRPVDPDQLARAVALVAAGATQSQAAHACGVNLTAVHHGVIAAGVHTPRKVPRGAGATTRRVEYLLLRLSAMTRADAAAAMGITVRTAQDYDKGLIKTNDAGRVRFIAQGTDAVDYNRYMTALLTATDVIEPGRQADPAPSPLVDPYRQIHPRYLSIEERERLFDLRKHGHGIRAIASRLGRSPSTVSRELRRNRTADGPYAPLSAQRKAAARRLRPKKSKIASNPWLKTMIQEKLAEFWSPEQIAGWLRLQYPQEKRWHVCHETIYQGLYIQARGGLKRQIQQALRHGRARRIPRTPAGQRTHRFVDEMVMIADRPAEAADRAVPGHWEGDLIMGAGNQSAIGTLVERSTRFVMLVHLPGGHDAAAMVAGLQESIGTLPMHLQRSLTWDQGTEMAGHKAFRVATGCPVYFCDPASPWQRGSNENTNGLLRQYFPKGTDLSVHSKEDLEFVARQLNDRPRKTLGYRTPAEELRALIDAT